MLTRPWEPATCRTAQLRQQLWLWLDAVVEWLVTEYVWEAADTIPACWPQHPHLVHEIAVLHRLRLFGDAEHASVRWIGYERYDAPSRAVRLAVERRVREAGAEAGLRFMRATLW